MAQADWQRIKKILDEAMTLPTGQRNAYLVQACGNNTVLRAEIDSLITADLDKAAFLDNPLVAAPNAPPAAALVSIEPRSHIGPYQCVDQLGRGGMGTVYLAEQRGSTGTGKVAVKLLEHGYNTPTFLSRFKREQTILAGLNHPNIARLHESGITQDGIPFLVMEFVDGPHLTDWSQEHELTILQRLQLFRKVCEAVRYAHANLVIHRDLKPSNILVDRKTGEPKLLDFGIARTFNPEGHAEEATVTLTGWTMLTPEYASPEQVSGKRLTTAHDVYALGVILYRLLTGRMPHKLKKESLEEVFHSLENSQPEKPSIAALCTAEDAQYQEPGPPLPRRKLHNVLRGDLDTIVMKAMHREPARRYESVEALSGDLQRFLDGYPIQARPETRLYVLRRFLRRNWRGVGATVLVVGLSLAFAVTTLYQKKQIEKNQQMAQKALAMLGFMEGLDSSTLNPEGGPHSLELLAAMRADLHLETIRDPGLKAQAVGKLATIYHRLGHFYHARQYYRQALDILAENPDLVSQNTRLNWMINLAEMYILFAKFTAANDVLKEADAIIGPIQKKKSLENRKKDGQDYVIVKTQQTDQMLKAKIHHYVALNELCSGKNQTFRMIAEELSRDWRYSTIFSNQVIRKAGRMLNGHGHSIETLDILVTEDSMDQAKPYLIWFSKIVSSLNQHKSGNLEAAHKQFQLAAEQEVKLRTTEPGITMLYLLAGTRLLQHMDRYDEAFAIWERFDLENPWSREARLLLPARLLLQPSELDHTSIRNLKILDPVYQSIRMDYIEGLLRQGQDKEAAAELVGVRAAQAEFPEHLSRETVSRQVNARILTAESVLARRKGNFAEAEEKLAQAKPKILKLFGTRSTQFGFYLTEEATLKGVSGNRQAARRLLGKAHDLLTRIHDPHAIAVTVPLLRLAELDFLEGNWQEAAALCEAALQIRRGMLPPKHSLHIEALRLYADIMEKQKPVSAQAIKEHLATLLNEAGTRPPQ